MAIARRACEQAGGGAVPVVEYELRLRREAVWRGWGDRKAVLRLAVAGAVPEAIARRPRVAFQDGMGIKRAIAAAIDDPAAFYRREFEAAYGKGARDGRIGG